MPLQQQHVQYEQCTIMLMCSLQSNFIILYSLQAQFYPCLICPKFTTILYQLLSRADLCPSHYALHSFRSGAATTAAAVGLTPSLIKTLGRWNSNVYMAYVYCPESVITTIPQRLSTASVSADISWNPDLLWWTVFTLNYYDGQYLCSGRIISTHSQALFCLFYLHVAIFYLQSLICVLFTISYLCICLFTV